jgi:hypothetical protein
MKGTSPSRGCGGSRESASKYHDEVSTFINTNKKGKSMPIVTVGIDLAKNVFAVHGVDEAGKAVLVKPKVTRDQLVALIAQLSPCLIGMEACSGAHHWARMFQQYGHTVKLMAPKLVAPYRMSGKRGKNDAADAAAICEAVTRPSMRFVPLKDEHQQATLCLHRTRQPDAWPARRIRRGVATEPRAFAKGNRGASGCSAGLGQAVHQRSA